ncbi:hypothetical protein GCM10027422_40380 [Hymenobacter arcticus]
MRTLLKLLACAALLLATPAARAQDGPPVMDWITPIIDAQRAADLRNSLLEHKAGDMNVGYTPTPALRQAAVKGYVARHQATDPALTLAITELNQAGKLNYATVYRQATASYGLYENDAAAALTTFFLLGYRIVNEVPAPSHDAAFAAWLQLLPGLAHSPQLAALGGAARFGEDLKMEYYALNLAWTVARKNAQLAAFQQNTATLFRTKYGLDYQKVQLTNKGFSKR